MNAKERDRLRELAKQWRGIADGPDMPERRAGWRALHSLRPERPMLLIEVRTVYGFVDPAELVCEDAFSRNVELFMLENIRHAAVGDDFALEPYFRLGWRLDMPSYGVDMECVRGEDAAGRTLGYAYKHAIASPEDVEKLTRREFSVDREGSLRAATLLAEAFGEALPVKLGNFSFLGENYGHCHWVGNFFFGLTWQLHRLAGTDQMLYWCYDHPEAMHRMFSYMERDRLDLFRFMEANGLVTANGDAQMAGPCFYGYCDDVAEDGPTGLADVWAWAESQETTSISPDMFEEFALPYLARLSSHFKHIYYGCCERVDDRMERIAAAIPNIRAFSVSPWNDFAKVGEFLGKRYVFSRKPAPQHISGATPDWDALRKDVRATKAAAQGPLELLFRDIYDVAGEASRLRRWTELARAELGL